MSLRATASQGEHGAAGDPSAPIERDAAAWALRSVELPPGCPTLVNRLAPPQSGRFQPADAARVALDDPAAVLNIYAEAQRREIAAADDLEQVIAALGADGMRAVADSLRHRDALAPDDRRSGLVRGYRHALAAARLARRFAPAAGVAPNRAAAAALLHDVGRLALLSSSLAPRVEALYAGAAAAPVPTAYLEQATLQMTHYEAGHALAERCDVPAALAAITRHHDWRSTRPPSLDEHGARLAAVVQLADALAKSHGYGGCDADELAPAPTALAPLAADNAAVRETLADVDRTLAAWWPGVAIDPTEEPVLRGIRVLLATGGPSAWSPAASPLAAAGATVLQWSGAREAAPAVVLIDGLGVPFAEVIGLLAALDRAAVAGPRLVLADRAFDPERRLAAAHPAAAVLPTPVRAAALIARVAALAQGAGDSNNHARA